MVQPLESLHSFRDGDVNFVVVAVEFLWVTGMSVQDGETVHSCPLRLGTDSIVEHPAHLPGPLGELHISESLHARRVFCSGWLGHHHQLGSHVYAPVCSDQLVHRDQRAAGHRRGIHVRM